MKKAVRQSNIELLRIVLMVMIIAHHLIVHGMGLGKMSTPGYEDDGFTYYGSIINCFLIAAVNTFIFISGYWGIKLKLRSIFLFVVQAVFYSVSLFLLFSFINPNTWSWKELIFSFFPISNFVWWFISAYLCLYFLSPLLNKGVEMIDRRQMNIVLGGFLFFDCISGGVFYSTISLNGYNFFHFIVIYLIGQYMKTYQINIKKPILLLFLSISLLLILVLIFLSMGKYGFTWRFFAYNNPIIMMIAIFLFYSFKSINIKYNNKINLLAGSVLGIYMIHEYIPIRNIQTGIIQAIKEYNWGNLTLCLSIFGLALLIFIICAAIELCRMYITNKLTDKLFIAVHNRKAKRNKQANVIKK